MQKYSYKASSYYKREKAMEKIGLLRGARDNVYYKIMVSACI